MMEKFSDAMKLQLVLAREQVILAKMELARAELAVYNAKIEFFKVKNLIEQATGGKIDSETLKEAP